MPAAIAVTEIEDVLLAKMVCALQISASCLNKDRLTSFFSTTASMTKSASRSSST
ncbi:Uncharacterised protein [Acinetobacter baumannii]|nr:Uncharacterised protein [Acinetobacter baumannii]